MKLKFLIETQTHSQEEFGGHRNSQEEGQGNQLRQGLIYSFRSCIIMIHCCVQLRTLGRRTTTRFPGKAANQDTCDQAISQDGESYKVCEYLILDLYTKHNIFIYYLFLFARSIHLHVTWRRSVLLYDHCFSQNTNALNTNKRASNGSSKHLSNI